VKIAICISSSVLGGVANSTSILYRGFKAKGLSPKIIVTSCDQGIFFEKLQAQNIDAEAVAAGMYWLKDRLEATFEAIKDYDVILNNHSREVWLLLPRFSEEVIKISVVRGVTKRNIREAIFNSNHLDALVGVSPAVESLLTPHAQCLTEMIANSVSAQADVLPRLDSRIRIVYLGRLSQSDKNILLLPEIIEALSSKGLDFEFDIIGDGPDRNRLTSRLNTLGFSDKVRLLGAMDFRDVEKHLRKSHFLVVPSNHESFGLILVEAMALGVIPVVSPLPVFSWILGDCASALQVKQNRGLHYADKVKWFVRNPDDYSTLQRKLFKRQFSMFTPQKMVQEYIDLIKNIHIDRENGTDRVSLCRTMNPQKMPLRYRIRCCRLYGNAQKAYRSLKYGRKYFYKGI